MLARSRQAAMESQAEAGLTSAAYEEIQTILGKQIGDMCEKITSGESPLRLQSMDVSPRDVRRARMDCLAGKFGAKLACSHQESPMSLL